MLTVTRTRRFGPEGEAGSDHNQKYSKTDSNRETVKKECEKRRETQTSQKSLEINAQSSVLASFMEKKTKQGINTVKKFPIHFTQKSKEKNILRPLIYLFP